MLNSPIPRDSEEVIVKRVLRRVERFLSEWERQNAPLSPPENAQGEAQFQLGDDNTATKIMGASSENTLPNFKAQELETVFPPALIPVNQPVPLEEPAAIPPPVAVPAPPLPAVMSATMAPALPVTAGAAAEPDPVVPPSPPKALPPPPQSVALPAKVKAQVILQPQKREVGKVAKAEQRGVKAKREESKFSPDSAIDNLFLENAKNAPSSSRTVSLVWILLGIVVFLAFVLALLLLRNSSFTY